MITTSKNVIKIIMDNTTKLTNHNYIIVNKFGKNKDIMLGITKDSASELYKKSDINIMICICNTSTFHISESQCSDHNSAKTSNTVLLTDTTLEDVLKFIYENCHVEKKRGITND